MTLVGELIISDTWTMILSAIVAASEDNAIGKDNDLLWRLPDDMKFFKTTTSGHPVIMGRKTLESFKRPLPNRENIVITRNRDYAPEGVHVTHELTEAINLAESFKPKEAFILGGGEIYNMALDHCDRVYLTRVHERFPQAEAHFPEMNPDKWDLVWEEHHEVDERHAYPFTFKRYDRKPG